jgi:transposase
MDSDELYSKILGLTGDDWAIRDISLDEGAGEVTVNLTCNAHRLATEAGGKLHGLVHRRWRHLDSCQFKTYVEADVPRVRLPDGSTAELEVGWAARFARVTKLMEAHVISVLEAARSHSAAAGLLEMGRGQLDRIMARAVERGMSRRAQDAIPHAGCDEKAMRRGHRYVSIMTDIARGRVVDLVEGRTKESAGELWRKLTPGQRDSVDAVAMDMWAAYMSSAKIYVPDADIVHDRFHVAKYLGEGVDKQRKAEHRELLKQGEGVLTGTKYDWLKRWDDLRSSAASSFRSVYKLALKTARAWRYKEAFDSFWDYRSEAWAKKFFRDWYNSLIHTNLASMKKVAKMLKKHLPGLLAYTRHRITNATAEGLNSKIQGLRTAARGLPKFETFRIRVLFHCGKLDLSPA